MKKSPSQFDRLVKQQMRWEPGISYDGAVDELVANGCMTMLQNTQAVKQVVRDHLNLAERFGERIHEIGEQIKAAFGEVDVNDDAAIYGAAKFLQESHEEIQQRWDKALAAATRNYNAEKYVEEKTGKKISHEGRVTQMITWAEAEKRFGIKSVNDFIGVQKSVISTLEKEGFFDGKKNVVTVDDGGMIVEITRDGIRETLGPGDRYQSLPRALKQAKIATIAQLPEVIQKARLKDDNVKNRENPKSGLRYAYLEGRGEYENAQRDISITVRKSQQKNKFWLHVVDLGQSKANELGLSSSGIRSQQEYNKAQARDAIIADIAEESKTKNADTQKQTWDNGEYADEYRALTEGKSMDELYDAMQQRGTELRTVREQIRVKHTIRRNRRVPPDRLLKAQSLSTGRENSAL